jgi:hypothetical protein
MARRAKKKNKNHYFTKDTENAIVAYASTDDTAERTKLYAEHIQPAFNELVDKIVFTYKFTSLQNIEVLKDDCKVWLTTILSKFNPDNGAKAFSYFSVVTKNWFTHKAKKQTQRGKREINYDNMIYELDAVAASDHSNTETKEEEQEFWLFLLREMDVWKQVPLKENEKKVLEAVEVLMKNIDEIEIFNKKAIYLYMREITGLNTKQIVTNLNKMRAKYKVFRQKWNNGDIK